ncbi:MAG TPA: ferrous iron transport protein A [Fimbriiglobus sp.]|nr:ferrous iron transport protein A [Fimbriiglobus sp.]
MPTLDQLLTGQRGEVETLAGDPELVQRLYEIGLLEGETVEVLGFAPLGDPVEVRVGNTRLSLRKPEAATVSVRLL